LTKNAVQQRGWKPKASSKPLFPMARDLSFLQEKYFSRMGKRTSFLCSRMFRRYSQTFRASGDIEKSVEKDYRSGSERLCIRIQAERLGVRIRDISSISLRLSRNRVILCVKNKSLAFPRDIRDIREPNDEIQQSNLKICRANIFICSRVRRPEIESLAE